MNNEWFERVFQAQVRTSAEILLNKAKEYADDVDRLANFRKAATIQGKTYKQALAGMMAKHTVSIYDMCAADANTTFSLEKWDEKITDHINYLILLRAMVVEEQVGHASDSPPTD